MTVRPMVLLRAVQDDDLPIFFQQQQDPAANYMAAFTPRNPNDRVAFVAHWHRIRNEATITIRTILFEGEVAGYVLYHHDFGQPEVSYWLGPAYWGRGVATQALAAFLSEQKLRPLYAHVAYDNIASLRVLQKCGFVPIGTDQGFANARGQEIEEIILQLD